MQPGRLLEHAEGRLTIEKRGMNFYMQSNTKLPENVQQKSKNACDNDEQNT
jgi:hypothetical protein